MQWQATPPELSSLPCESQRIFPTWFVILEILGSQGSVAQARFYEVRLRLRGAPGARTLNLRIKSPIAPSVVCPWMFAGAGQAKRRMPQGIGERPGIATRNATTLPRSTCPWVCAHRAHGTRLVIPSPSARPPGSGASPRGQGGAPHWTNDLDP